RRFSPLPQTSRVKIARADVEPIRGVSIARKLAEPCRDRPAEPKRGTACGSVDEAMDPSGARRLTLSGARAERFTHDQVAPLLEETSTERREALGQSLHRREDRVSVGPRASRGDLQL